MNVSPLPREFHTGLCFDAYKHLGARPHREAGQQGWAFRIWPPGWRFQLPACSS